MTSPSLAALDAEALRARAREAAAELDVLTASLEQRTDERAAVEGSKAAARERIEELTRERDELRSRLEAIERTVSYRALVAARRAVSVARGRRSPPPPAPAARKEEPQLQAEPVEHAADDRGLDRWLEHARDATVAVAFTDRIGGIERGQRSHLLGATLAAGGGAVLLEGGEDGDGPIGAGPRALDVALDREELGARGVLVACRPDVETVALTRRARAAGWIIVFDARGEPPPTAAWSSRTAEAALAREADVVSAVSPRLADRLTTVSGRDDIRVIGNAAWGPDDLPERIPSSPAVIGCVASPEDGCFDQGMLFASARNNPTIRFEIVAPFLPATIEVPDNVALLGPCDPDEVALLASRWSATVAPYAFAPRTESLDPIAVYTSLVLQVPVLVSHIPHLRGVPGVHLAESTVAFSEALPAVAGAPFPIEEATAWLAGRTWRDRAAQLLALLEGGA